MVDSIKYSLLFALFSSFKLKNWRKFMHFSLPISTRILSAYIKLSKGVCYMQVIYRFISRNFAWKPFILTVNKLEYSRHFFKVPWIHYPIVNLCFIWIFYSFFRARDGFQNFKQISIYVRLILSNIMFEYSLISILIILQRYLILRCSKLSYSINPTFFKYLIKCSNSLNSSIGTLFNRWNWARNNMLWCVVNNNNAN